MIDETGTSGSVGPDAAETALPIGGVAAVHFSYSSADQDSVEQLKDALQERGVPCQMDALELVVDEESACEVKRRIRAARSFLVVLSPTSIANDDLRRQIEWALHAEDHAAETGGNYRLIPICARGVRPEVLDWLARRDVVALEQGRNPLEALAPWIVQALKWPPGLGRPLLRPPPLPAVSELVLEFDDLRASSDGVRGSLRIGLKLPERRRSSGPSLEFVAASRPTSSSRDLAAWGKNLLASARRGSRDLFDRFRDSEGDRRVVVRVPPCRRPAPTAEAVVKQAADAAGEAAGRILGVPWERLLDEMGCLLAGATGAQLVRRVRRSGLAPEGPGLRRLLRVLLVVSRTTDDAHADARPPTLATALAGLDDRIDLEVLPDGSLPSLEQALHRADEAGRPFHVVHFDGACLVEKATGRGLLGFENTRDTMDGKAERRRREVEARRLGAVLRRGGVPLFVLHGLECGSPTGEVAVRVATELLEGGAGSVVATGATTPVSSRDWSRGFYRALATGLRIGAAVNRGRNRLLLGATWATGAGAGPQLRWDGRLPVLFQDEGADVPLVPAYRLPDSGEHDMGGRLAKRAAAAPARQTQEWFRIE